MVILNLDTLNPKFNDSRDHDARLYNQITHRLRQGVSTTKISEDFNISPDTIRKMLCNRGETITSVRAEGKHGKRGGPGRPSGAGKRFERST